MLKITNASSLRDLKQILELQEQNLKSALNAEEQKQGFVMVQHDIEILDAMNVSYPHVVAKDKGKIVGYALSMLKEFENKVPALVPMFRQLNSCTYNGKPLSELNYVVMGQICIAKEQRGKGLFKQLYQKFKEQMTGKFKFIVTEVSKNNQRSLDAHKNLGFVNICEYSSDVDGEDWVVMIWQI